MSATSHPPIVEPAPTTDVLASADVLVSEAGIELVLHSSVVLTCLELVYLEGVDGTDVRSPTAGKVEGLLVTGRSIGGDRDSHAAVRNMMCCTVAGQGAGGAAAVSLRSGRSFPDVDVAEAQAELKHQGVRVF